MRICSREGSATCRLQLAEHLTAQMALWLRSTYRRPSAVGLNLAQDHTLHDPQIVVLSLYVICVR